MKIICPYCDGQGEYEKEIVMPYHCSSCKEEHETGKVCDKPMLVQAEGVNWQSCQEGHARILHREMLCPLCAEKIIV